MKKILLALLLLPAISEAQCCLTNSLIINTGYNPLGAGAAVPGGTQGGTAVTDPHWKICYMDPQLINDITTSGLGLIPVVPSAPADVILPVTGWATFPGGAGGPGEWINSFNGYNYIQTTDSNYSWIVSRTFTLYCDAEVTFNFTNITIDNWLLDGGIDGPGCDAPGTGYIPMPGITLTPYCCYGLLGGTGISVFGGNPGIFYTIPAFTENLAAGVHTIYFRMLNDNTPNNNIGIAIQANITTPSPSIVPENIAACTTPTICPATEPPVCIGSTIVLSDDGIAGGTWASSNTNIASITGTGTVSAVSPGTTTAIYNLPAGLGCPSIDIITVSPGATTSGHTNINVCADKGADTLSAPAGYTSYLWNNGSTATFIPVTSSGTYWVEAFSPCGTFADTFYTSMSPAPVVALGNDTSLCSGITMTLSSTQPPGAVYDWSTGSHDTSITIDNSGTYSLTVTLNGCSATGAVSVSQLSKPVVNLGGDTTLCTGYSLSLKLNNATNATYLWSNGGTGQTLTISEAGTYWVIASNICGTAKDTITVDVGACEVALPTAFSPNNDGSNDILYVRGAGIKTLDLKIYNRFGQMVFETTSQNKGWDGTFNGQPQPIEVYAYVLNASMIDGSIKVLKGNITLLR